MAAYVVSYDLKQGSGTHDYSDLDKAFAKLNCHKILYSVYLVSTTSTPGQLSKSLLGHMDPKDRLWVSEVHKDEYAGRIMEGGLDWLKKNPPRP